MIHYHGTPIGGTNNGAAEFLVSRHAMVSHAHQKQMGIVAEACQSFTLDNGAFSQWKRGKSVDFKAYGEWISEWSCHPGFDWCLIPDEIDGNEKDNDALLDTWINSENARHGVPVWHYHESFERLERLLALVANHATAPVLALGSSGAWPTPGSARWWERTAQVMRVLCDAHGRPRVKLHGLRMLNPKVFSYMPLSSADSTNVGRNQGQKERFGMYVPPSSGQRATVIAHRIEAFNSSPVWCGGPCPDDDDRTPSWMR